MIKSVLAPDNDPLGLMLKDYMAGESLAFLEVESPLLDMSEMKASTLFRTLAQMTGLELRALDLCQGEILDVGAGSGCHSLALQKAGHDVTALDISPGCMDVMDTQGVKKRIFDSLFNLDNQRFNTMLMLMNGIGICGSIEGLNYFFQHIRGILCRGGQVLADSTDLAAMHVQLPLVPDESCAYYGETQFIMSYKGNSSDPFDWLYIDYATLAFYAEFHGWRCEQIMKMPDGKFLARIY